MVGIGTIFTIRNIAMAEIKLGVMGYGGRISGMIRGFKQYDGSVRVAAVIDPNEEFVARGTPLRRG